MKHRGVVLFFGLSLVAAAPRPYLAKVNGEAITGETLRSEFVKRHGGHEKFLGGDGEVRKFLDLVIDARLLIQEAYRLQLDQEPDIRNAVAEREAEASVDYLVRTEVDEKSQPSEEEIRNAWEEKTTELVETRQIVLESADRAETVRARVLAGENFETLARELSVAPSKTLGGYLPLVGWGAMEPAWEEAVWALCPGEVSPVIRTSAGFEIVQLGARNVFERPPFEKAHNRIEGILKRRKLEERKKAFSTFLWSKYDARAEALPATAEELGRVRRETPTARIATWKGGFLTIGEAVSADDVQELSAATASGIRDAIERRLRAAVNERLSRLEARERGVARVPEVADRVRRYEEDLVEGALYEQFVLKDVKVAESDVRAYYESHKAELVAPEKRRVSHIVLRTMEEAQDVRQRALAGESFDDLVREHSTDAASKKAGGDLGWITGKDVPEGFGGVLTLHEGEISEPIASKFGYHVVKVTKAVPAQPLSYENAAADIRQALTQARQRAQRAEWVQKLRAAAKVSVDDAALHAFALAEAAEVAPPRE